MTSRSKVPYATPAAIRPVGSPHSLCSPAHYADVCDVALYECPAATECCSSVTMYTGGPSVVGPGSVSSVRRTVYVLDHSW